MEYRIPKPGEIYRHFKGNMYEIVLIARDSETLEEKVVYKEVDGESAYVRSLPMFVSLVDKEKYPNVSQEYRFEFAGAEEKPTAVPVEEEKLPDYSIIMEFLDLDSASEKLSFVENRKNELTEEFLCAAAQSLDFVESERNLEDRYEALLRYLRTVARYESGRMR